VPQSFADQRFINAWADSRAYMAMLAAKTPEHAEKNRYHWGIVEAIDGVMALDQGLIDAMPEDDIRDMRFLQSPNRHTPLYRVSAAIHTERAVRTPLGNTTFFDCTLALLNRGAFRDKEEQKIAGRFLLACARLTIGGPAYDEPDDTFKYRRGRTRKTWLAFCLILYGNKMNLEKIRPLESFVERSAAKLSSYCLYPCGENH
jgi:hypothetical protein